MGVEWCLPEIHIGGVVGEVELTLCLYNMTANGESFSRERSRFLDGEPRLLKHVT